MAKNIEELTVEELKKKINSAKIAIERNTGMIKAAAEKKLAKLEAELSTRAGEAKKDVKEDVKAVEKEVKKVEKKVEKDLGIKSKKFRHKKTGKIVTQVPILKINDYEEVKDDSSAKKTSAKKDTVKKTATKKPAEKKAPAKKKPRVYGSPTEKFELTIDGKVFKFSDLASKNECEKATKAVQARYKEVKEHKQARKEGAAKAASIPVTRRISDGFASIAKKAVSEVPVTKIDKKPEDVKKELEAVEVAFNNLFDKLGALMGKEIPKTQRKQIMDILTKFENKIDKGSDKKAAATSKVRKEQGGMAGASKDAFGAGNPYSYASLM